MLNAWRLARHSDLRRCRQQQLADRPETYAQCQCHYYEENRKEIDPPNFESCLHRRDLLADLIGGMVQPFRCQGQSQPSAKEGANVTSAIPRSSGGRCCYLASDNSRTAEPVPSLENRFPIRKMAPAQVWAGRDLNPHSFRGWFTAT